jgi:phosphoglycolate phosphatase-like HAD superfamily hydrolase
MYGIKTIGVSWGFGKVQDMVAAGAIDIVDSPAQLLKKLLK